MSPFDFVYSVLLVVIVTSNLLILVDQYQLRKDPTSSNIFIASLSFSNIIVGVVTFVSYVIANVYNQVSETDVFDCSVIPYLQMLSMSSNVFCTDP